MTATVNNLLESVIRSNRYTAFSVTVGLIAILLLIVLMVQKELLRTSKEAGEPRDVQVFDIAIVPLLFVFAFIIVVRFLALLS